MKIEAHAKVNLTLEVFGRRADGYHDLRSVVLPIPLCDIIEIEEAEILSSDTGFADDLCLKAARTLDPSRGARIRVTKRIPVGGGLGGGSADAAAVLVALNDLWKLGHTREELAVIGAQVGSDVPALVLGGAVLMEGRGEKVTRIPMAHPIEVMLRNPGIHVSTKEVYAACSPHAKTPFAGSPSERTAQALADGDMDALARAMMNDLQTPAIQLHPQIADEIAALRGAGALGVQMSGSGSSVFGIVWSKSGADCS